jgi:uncharacterized protein YprB with RNaseH-like and TPR domain
MIESSFIFLKGIGEFTERRLWGHGVADWQAFRDAAALPGITPSRKVMYDAELAAAQEHFRQGSSRYFARCLKPRDQWRLFKAFRERAVFLDIETTGTSPSFGDVTVVGLYGRGTMTSLVRGDSLNEDRLNEALAPYDLLVTFFGSIFDVPYLKHKFPGLVLDQPHFDLCFAARRLGLTGGLKQIELQLEIERSADLQGLDGWEAVRLWQSWRYGSAEALDRLIRYNEADSKNLEPLADIVYERLAAKYGPSGWPCSDGLPVKERCIQG